MVGYYKIDEKDLKMKIRNIEDNIYDLCCPLLVTDKRCLSEEILYLYEILEIPIMTYTDYSEYDKIKNVELEKYIDEFSKYLKINTDIELLEDEKLGHALRVAKYAYDLAKYSNLSRKECKDIYIASLFHDVGKIKVSDKIIGKKGVLTEKEFLEIKKHSSLAIDVLGHFFKESVLEIIKSHHERMNKSGYPDGISPVIGAQILGIVDSYDAMVSPRVYQIAKTKEQALEELQLCTVAQENGGKGIFFNAELVNLFIKLQNGNVSDAYQSL